MITLFSDDETAGICDDSNDRTIIPLGYMQYKTAKCKVVDR